MRVEKRRFVGNSDVSCLVCKRPARFQAKLAVILWTGLPICAVSQASCARKRVVIHVSYLKCRKSHTCCSAQSCHEPSKVPMRLSPYENNATLATFQTRGWQCSRRNWRDFKGTRAADRPTDYSKVSNTAGARIRTLPIRIPLATYISNKGQVCPRPVL